MSGHRGTRGRMRAPGSQGGHTLGSYAEGLGSSAKLPPDATFGERVSAGRRANMFAKAKRNGVAFSSFPLYVKATHLASGNVGYGHDHYSALQAIHACALAVAGDREIIKLQRAVIFREFAHSSVNREVKA